MHWILKFGFFLFYLTYITSFGSKFIKFPISAGWWCRGGWFPAFYSSISKLLTLHGVWQNIIKNSEWLNFPELWKHKTDCINCFPLYHFVHRYFKIKNNSDQIINLIANQTMFICLHYDYRLHWILIHPISDCNCFLAFHKLCSFY